MCRITVGGSREKERTCGIQVARHVPRAKRHQDITSMQNSGVHITILYVTRKWIPFTAYVSPISLESKKVFWSRNRSTFDYSYRITRRVTKANLIEFRDTTRRGNICLPYLTCPCCQDPPDSIDRTLHRNRILIIDHRHRPLSLSF